MLNGYTGIIMKKGNNYDVRRLVIAESPEQAQNILEEEFKDTEYRKIYVHTTPRYPDIKSGTSIQMFG